MEKKDKNYIFGKIFLILGIALAVFGLYLVKSNKMLLIENYIVASAFIISFVGAYLLGGSKKVITEEKKIKSPKAFLKKKLGRGAVIGLITGMLLDLPLIFILIWALISEVIFLSIFYYFYKKRNRKLSA